MVVVSFPVCLLSLREMRWVCMCLCACLCWVLVLVRCCLVSIGEGCWCFSCFVGELYESKRSDMFKVPGVDWIRHCGVVVFALFYASWAYVMVSVIVVVCCPIYVSVCV